MKINKLKKGLLITFEGIDGSGKTTILNKIKNNNIIKSLHPIYTSEPSKLYNTYNILKSYFYSKNNDPIEELFLFMANHARHVNDIIKPYIKKKNIISKCNIRRHYTKSNSFYIVYS